MHLRPLGSGRGSPPRGAPAAEHTRAHAPRRARRQGRGGAGAGNLGEVSCKSRAEAQRTEEWDAAGAWPAAPRGGWLVLRVQCAPGARVGRRARRGLERAEPAWPEGQRDAPTRRAGRISFEARRSIPGFLNPQPTSCPDPQPERKTHEAGAGVESSPRPRALNPSPPGGFPSAHPACCERGRPAGAAVFVFISIAALCVPSVRPDPPPLPPPGRPPSPTPICHCQMRKSPRRTQTLQPPRAPFGTWQHAAADSSAQLGGASATQLSGLLCI